MDLPPLPFPMQKKWLPFFNLKPQTATMVMMKMKEKKHNRRALDGFNIYHLSTCVCCRVYTTVYMFYNKPGTKLDVTRQNLEGTIPTYVEHAHPLCLCTHKYMIIKVVSFCFVVLYFQKPNTQRPLGVDESVSSLSARPWPGPFLAFPPPSPPGKEDRANTSSRPKA